MKLALFICSLLVFQSSMLSQSVDCSRTIDSLMKTSKRSLSKENQKELRPCIYAIQTKGFNLAEQGCKYDSARMAIEQALSIWQHINDTLNQANLLKYLGYLNGRLGYFEKAKNQIAKAIILFDLKHDESGVAVSLYDLAQVYEYENKIDSAILLTQRSLVFWKQRNVAGRIVGLNNHLINLFTKTNTNFTRADPLIGENTAHLASQKIYYLQELDFYFVTYKYYEKLRDEGNTLKFKTLYNNRTAALNKNVERGVYSLYDERNCR